MKRTALIISVLSLIVISADAFASKLVRTQVVDSNFIMAYFYDGDVCFADSNQGTYAYTSLNYTGWDWVVTYGLPLSTVDTNLPQNWVITSADDSNYTTGLNPTNCYRKSKINGMSQGTWNTPANDWHYYYTMEHTIYLKLPYPMVQGDSYTIGINADTNSDTLSQTLTFDIFNSISEAVHVNMVGYLADSSVKAVDLYMWMGDYNVNPISWRSYTKFEGNKVYIYDVNTSTSQQVGTVTFWAYSATDLGNYNLTASNVWKADFTGFNTPGTYRIAIDGVGCSQNFEIKKDVYFEPFKVQELGYFYQRIGETDINLRPPPRQPAYIPHVSPSNTIVYITSNTTLTDWDNTTKWAPYKVSGNPQNNNAIGGHADAEDWDRNLGHISIIYDMLLPYILTDGRLNDDNLGIPESGNGIPDILDEARNEVDFWLHLTYNGGYSYGLTNPYPNNCNAPPNSSNVLYQAGNTAIAAWANAANASMLAYCFKLAGLNDLCTTYTNSALTAYNYASSQGGLTSSQNVGNVIVRGKDLKMTAAAYLYNLTGNTAYEDMVNSLSEVTSPTSTIIYTLNSTTGWNQLWAVAGYLKTKQPVHYPTLFSNMKASLINEAKNQEANFSTTRPSRRATDDNLAGTGSWKTSQNVQRTIVGHAVADSPSDKTLFENAMVLEADWGLGRNSLNIIYMTTWTTSLASKRSIENMFTWARNDGVPGLDPGHTPYLGLSNWGGTSVAANPSVMTNQCYPVFGGNLVTSAWPIAEGYFNTRYVYAHSEFTPQQSWRGKSALYGYLYGLYKPALADFDSDGDVDLYDLAVIFNSWLNVPGDATYNASANLYGDPCSIVNFSDFAFLANEWNPSGN